jgi:hypothetical protein
MAEGEYDRLFGQETPSSGSVPSSTLNTRDDQIS